MRTWARRAVALGVVGVVTAHLAAVLAPFGWPFELFAHFRWQVGAATVLVLLAAALVRARWMLVVAALALAAQALPLFVEASATAPDSRSVAPASDGRCPGPALEIASVNLYFRNADPGPARQWLRTNPADVIVLQEFTPAWQQALAEEIARYPHRRLLAREDPYGIALLSRRPLANARPVDFAGDGLPSLVAEVGLAGGTVQIVGMHTRWPVMPELQRLRDRSLVEAARLVRESGRPAVLVGDLNLTPYAPAFGQLLRESGLVDVFAGRRWRPTWRAGFWPLALPIDHALVPADACVARAGIGPDLGSDHRPIHVTLSLPVT